MNQLLAIIQRPWRIRKLKRRYYQLSFQEPKQAQKSLQRQIVILKTKRPGYSDEWYLEKIVYDLEKDRR
ncbi:MAG TPA: hypothetical protein GXX58_09255 [Gelria sp.]|nr:hypothetical protein [Gelria sp.]